MCTKFQITEVILTLIAGVGDENKKIPVAEKVINAIGNRVKGKK